MTRNAILFLTLSVFCFNLLTCVSDQESLQGINNKSSNVEKAICRNTVRISITQDGKEIQSGSGFVINYKKRNYVITNAHVIGYNEGSSIQIHSRLPGGEFERFYNTAVVAEDEDNDLAVLTFQGIEKKTDSLPVRYDRELLQTVIAAGFPAGAEEKDITFTAGKISNPTVKVEKRERIKLDIAVNPGNSGGPLVNENGEALGVVYMKYGDSDGVAYAIPIRQVLETIDGIEENKNEQELLKIAKSKLEIFMQSIVFNPPDVFVSVNLFTFDYRMSLNTFFSSIYTFSNYIVKKAGLQDLPDPSSKSYADFELALIKLAEDYGVFDKIKMGKSTPQKNRLINLGYQSIYEFITAVKGKIDDIYQSSISNEKKIAYSKILVDEYTRFYSRKFMNDVVFAHFKDIKNIDNFEVVGIEQGIADESTVWGYVKIKYIDNIENIKFKIEYSRGKWAISSIGGGVLGEDIALTIKNDAPDNPSLDNKIVSFEKSAKAKRLYKGAKAPYKLWVDDSKWDKSDQHSNLISEYEFVCKKKSLYGYVIAEGTYVPIESLDKLVMYNARTTSSGASIIHKEYRIINGTEMLFLIIDAPIDKLQINYIFCYYLYSGKSFGTVQLISCTFKSLYDDVKDDMIEFLNGIVVAE